MNISWATNHGITDLAATRNPFNATGPGATWNYTLDAKTVLMQSNSLWLFVKGTNEASTPTNAWRQLGFDDSGWSNAPAPFFYGDPYSNGVPAYTLLSDMRSNYTSIYLRKTFVLGNAAAITNLYLRAQIDDGMIVWINGVEVLRTNAPAGEMPYNSTALNAYAGERRHALRDPAAAGSARLPGVGHERDRGACAERLAHAPAAISAFNAQLFTYQADTEVAAPRIVRKDPPPGYELDLTNITVTFSEPVTNVDAADLLINGVPATGLAQRHQHHLHVQLPAARRMAWSPSPGRQTTASWTWTSSPSPSTARPPARPGNTPC